MLTYLYHLKSKGVTSALILASLHIDGMQLERHLRCIGMRSGEFGPATKFEKLVVYDNTSDLASCDQW